MTKNKVTEQNSLYRHLEQKTVGQLLIDMNKEDQSVPLAVEKAIPLIEPLIEIIVAKMKTGGRLFYMGAGTSGRLGILDASECPPTFGVSDDWIIGLIAGGDRAIRKSVEHAEDDITLAWRDLQLFEVNEKDVVIGIAASGTTPYVVNGLKDCQENGITTGCITCNNEMPISVYADYPIEVVVGPEFVTGSTRLKSGTAQKLILNMISTVSMIRLGRVLDNKMVDMQLNNDKLFDRGINILINTLEISKAEATVLLKKHKTVRKAIEHYEL